MRKSIYIFCLGIFLSILAFIPSNWLSFGLPKIFLLNLTLLISYIFAFKAEINLDELTKKLKNPANQLIIGYFIILVIYTIFSISPLSSFFGISSTYTGLLSYFNLFFLYLFTLVFINSDNKKTVLGTLIITNIIVTIYGLLQILNLDPFSNIWIEEKFLGRIFSFIGHPNWFAAFIVLTLPLVVYKLFELYQKKNCSTTKIAYTVLFFLNLINIIATVSKSAILALFFMGFVFAIKYWLHKKNFQFNLKIIFIAFTIIIPLTIFSTYSLKNRYENSFENGRSTNSREIIWKSSFKMLLDNPLGMGLESFQLKYPQYNNPKLWEYDNLTARIDKSHNQIIELYSIIGPFGLIIFYLAMIVTIFLNIKKEIFSLEFFLNLSVIGYLITNLFGFDVIPNLIVFFIIIGISVSNNQKTEIHFKGKLSKIFLTLTILILIITFQFNLKHLIANNYYSKADSYLQIGNYQKAAINFQKAIEKYPYDRIYLLQSIEFFVVIYDPNSDNAKDFENLLTNYINKLKKLTNNLEPELAILEAWFEAKKGNLEQFKIKLNEAYAKNPSSALTYKISSSIYKDLEDKENQQKELEKLKAILPSYWNKPETEAGRIFQKNNSWVLQLITIK